MNSWYKGLSLAWVPLKQAGTFAYFPGTSSTFHYSACFFMQGSVGRENHQWFQSGSNQGGHSFVATVSCFPFPSSELFFFQPLFWLTIYSINKDLQGPNWDTDCDFLMGPQNLGEGDALRTLLHCGTFNFESREASVEGDGKPIPKGLERHWLT